MAQVNQSSLAQQTHHIFSRFLRNFEIKGKYLFREDAEEFYKHERSMMYIKFNHIQQFDFQFSNILIEHAYELYPVLCQAAKQFIEEILDVKLDKQVYIGLEDYPTLMDIREINSSKFGRLMKIRGHVVRTHPVHPELVSGCFTCDQCNSEMINIAQEFIFTQPTICHNPKCGNKTNFTLNIDKSVFVDFQKIRIQETQDKIPKGGMPRSIDLISRSENVESLAQPGIKCDFIGIPIVLPDLSNASIPGIKNESISNSGAHSSNQDGNNLDSGMGLSSNAIGPKEVSYSLSFLVLGVKPFETHNVLIENEEQSSAIENLKKRLSDEECKKIYQMSKDPNLFSNLAHSMFPNILGNENIKKGILLLLFGGVHKKTHENIKLRGDINICIVGDPSTAKSQFLKTVCRIYPRSVYTSGKSSSAAGLTAAVVRDDETGDFVIEAGALMLANNGICCIDEFDKMDISDQVAIHEAMEQQTISIAKAGVKATLNARASILAAANPVNGQYEKEKSLRYNIRMSAPIMSRFDLFFVLVDECNRDVDTAIAKRIIDVHSSYLQKTDKIHVKYTIDEIIRFISFAKLFCPVLSKEASDYLTNSYKRLRSRVRNSSSSRKNNIEVTVRQLESLIRLSEALAKVECSESVSINHAKQAFEIFTNSIVNVEQQEIAIFYDDQADDLNELIDNDKADQENLLPYSQQEKGGRTKISKMLNKLGSKHLLNYEEYKRISNILIMRIKWFTDDQQEIISSNTNTSDPKQRIGMKKSELIKWYLEEVIEDELQSEVELKDRTFQIDAIIERLIQIDKVLIKVSGISLLSNDELKRNLTAQSDLSDPLLLVHPNYIV